MSDRSVPGGTLRVTTCDTDETLAAASGLFDQYRHHYGGPPDRDGRIDNQAALNLYRKLGFIPVEGLATLSLDLAPDAIRD